MDAPPLCPLCRRPIPPGVKASRHHLTPRLKGGARGETVLLHDICHRTLHAQFSEAELARHLTSIDALRANPGIARFLVWVARRPPEFTSRIPGPRRKR